jgi:hypothetical protein
VLVLGTEDNELMKQQKYSFENKVEYLEKQCHVAGQV